MVTLRAHLFTVFWLNVCENWRKDVEEIEDILNLPNNISLSYKIVICYYGVEDEE